MILIRTTQNLLLVTLISVAFASINVLASETQSGSSEPDQKVELQNVALKTAIKDAFRKSYFPHPQSRKGLAVVSFELDDQNTISKIKVIRVPNYRKSKQADSMTQKVLVYAVKNLGKLPVSLSRSRQIKVTISVDNRSSKEKIKVEISPIEHASNEK